MKKVGKIEILRQTVTSSHALGQSWVRLNLNNETIFLSLIVAVDTCLDTGTAEEVVIEEVINCVKNTLDITGHGDCKACI